MTDMFDKFQDPSKKKKQQEKKEKRKQKDWTEFMERGKLYAKDFYNEPLDDETLNKWSSELHLEQWDDEKKVEHWTQVFKTFTSKDVGFKHPKKKPKGLEVVFQFVEAGEFCLKFVEEKRIQLGWKQNLTGYNPVTVSASINEMIFASAECYRMMIKQAIRVVCQLKGWTFPVDLLTEKTDERPKKKVKKE